METPFAIIISQGSFETSKWENINLGVISASGHGIGPLQKEQQCFEISIGVVSFIVGKFPTLTTMHCWVSLTIGNWELQMPLATNSFIAKRTIKFWELPKRK